MHVVVNGKLYALKVVLVMYARIESVEEMAELVKDYGLMLSGF